MLNSYLSRDKLVTSKQLSQINAKLLGLASTVLDANSAIGTKAWSLLLISSAISLMTIGCTSEQKSAFSPADISLMAMVRCLVTGGHMSENEGTRFVAQIVKEQSGQFQNVYDAISTGVPDKTNEQVLALVKTQGGCRKMLTDWTDSEPETPFKKSIELDWILKPIKYFDEK